MRDIRLSVSKAKTFEHCKAQFNFDYNLKMPKKDYDFLWLGKFVHFVLEKFHLAYLNGSQEDFNIEMTKAYKQGLEEFKDNLNSELKKEAYPILKSYLNQIIDLKNKNKLPTFLAVEKQFSLEIIKDDMRVTLNGCIDRIQIDADGITHVIDYKTTKNKKYLKNDFFQLLTYAFVLSLEDPSLAKIRGSYVLLRHEHEHLTKDFDITEISQIKNTFFDYADKIFAENKWEPSPSKLCSYCSFLEHCDAGKKEVQVDTTYGEISW